MARWDEGRWEGRGRWGEEDRPYGREGWRGSEGWRGNESWRGEEDRGSGGWREGGRDWREEGGGWRGEPLRSGERRAYIPRGREHEWSERDVGHREEGWLGRDRGRDEGWRGRDEDWFGRDYGSRDKDWRRNRERMGRWGQGEDWGREDRDRDWRGEPWRGSGGSMGGMYGGTFGGYGSAREDFGGGASRGFGRQDYGEYYAGSDQGRWEGRDWGRGEERGPMSRLGEKMREGWRKMTGKGPKGYHRSDERIREDVCERIARAGLDADDVEVQVANAEVTLLGQVGDRDTKRWLEDVAEDVFGVEEVHNRIRMRREERAATGTAGMQAGQTTQTAQPAPGGQQTVPRHGSGTSQPQPGASERH